MGILKKLFTAENLLQLGLVSSCLAIVLLSPSEKFNDIIPLLGMTALGSGLFLSLVSFARGYEVGRKNSSMSSYIKGYRNGVHGESFPVEDFEK